MSDACGYIRVMLPRYAAAGQLRAMEVNSIPQVIQDGGTLRESEHTRVVEGTLEGFLRWAGKGRLMAVQHLFLLADPKAKPKRKSLFAAIDHIESKGGILWELSTGRRGDDRKQRDRMIRDAIDALATGRHKTRVSDKRGRPKKVFPPEVIEKARAVWFSRRYKTWDAAAKRLPKGMTKWDAYELFKGRDQDEDEKG
jgi:hypothetical protein